jgi:hypothetical protein
LKAGQIKAVAHSIPDARKLQVPHFLYQRHQGFTVDTVNDVKAITALTKE